MLHRLIQVKPISGGLGAEIDGVDLSTLDDTAFAEINQAFLDHQVIFFRDQDITLDQHKDFGRKFGHLHVHPSAPGPEGHPDVLTIHADENAKQIAGERWHSDVSCDPEPPMGSILRLHTIPPEGGDTLFASMYAAYDALSDTLKAFLEPLTAIHAGEQVYRGRYKHQGIDDSGKTYPESEHPVVRTHPVSGRKSLYVNETFTTRIPQLAQKESDAILKLLCDHIKLPQFQVRFKWQENSVAFWDNRSVQHHAMWDYFPEVRSGYRVTVKGDKPA